MNRWDAQVVRSLIQKDRPVLAFALAALRYLLATVTAFAVAYSAGQLASREAGNAVRSANKPAEEKAASNAGRL